MPEDDEPEDDWIMCGSCKIWVDETCGEKQDIISDANSHLSTMKTIAGR